MKKMKPVYFCHICRRTPKMKQLRGLPAISVLAAIFVFLQIPCHVYASDSEQITEKYMGELLENEEYRNMEDTVRNMLPGREFDFSDYIQKILRGEESISLKTMRAYIEEGVKAEFNQHRSELVGILGIVLVTAVFTSFARAFRNGQVAESGYYVAYLLLFTVLAAGYLAVSSTVTQTLGRLADFMKVLVPVFSASLAFSAGGLTGGAASATLLMLMALVDELLIAVLLPVIHVYMMAVLANHLTQEEPLTKMTELLARGIRFSLKTMLGFVTGISMLQSMLAPVVDKTKRDSLIKVSEMIPALGGMLSGAAETVLGAGNVIKNAIGTGGMIVVLLICLLPMVRVLVSSFCYRVGAAIVEPVADKRIVRCLSDTAEGVSMLFQTLTFGAVMFLMTLAILIRATM